MRELRVRTVFFIVFGVFIFSIGVCSKNINAIPEIDTIGGIIIIVIALCTSKV